LVLPFVFFGGVSVECPPGANLRMVLVRARLPLYTTAARALHCRGRGSCGTCAVKVEGRASEPTPAEFKRLGKFPHELDGGLRLACQVRVNGDLTVTKHRGFFGTKAELADAADGADPTD
jgi:ferredoxin